MAAFQTIPDESNALLAVAPKLRSFGAKKTVAALCLATAAVTGAAPAVRGAMNLSSSFTQTWTTEDAQFWRRRPARDRSRSPSRGRRRRRGKSEDDASRGRRRRRGQSEDDASAKQDGASAKSDAKEDAAEE